MKHGKEMNQISHSNFTRKDGEIQPLRECPRCEVLENAFIRARTRRSYFVVSAAGYSPENLYQLESDELMCLFSLLDHRATEH